PTRVSAIAMPAVASTAAPTDLSAHGFAMSEYGASNGVSWTAFAASPQAAATDVTIMARRHRGPTGWPVGVRCRIAASNPNQAMKLAWPATSASAGPAL